MGASLSQPNSYNYLPGGKVPPRHDSTQSDTSLLNMVTVGSNLAQQNRSGSDLCLMTGGRGDVKVPSTISAGMANGSYGDLGWLNLDNCCSMLSASPNLSSYCDLPAGGMGIPPPDQFQLSLMEDQSLRNSSGNLNGLTNSGEVHPFLDSTSTGHSMLFGAEESHLLDRHGYR